MVCVSHASVCMCVCLCVTTMWILPSSVNDKEADNVHSILFRRRGPHKSEQYCPALQVTPCLSQSTGCRHKQVSYTMGREGRGGEGRGVVGGESRSHQVTLTSQGPCTHIHTRARIDKLLSAGWCWMLTVVLDTYSCP